MGGVPEHLEHDAVVELIRRDLQPGEYDEIRELWKRHSLAEDARDLPGLISTLTEDCVYELMQSGRRFEGHEGAARFYDSVMQLSETYRTRLPLELTEVRHENLVNDFAGETQRICSCIGIPWTAKLAKFAERRRPVVTPSASRSCVVATSGCAARASSRSVVPERAKPRRKT